MQSGMSTISDQSRRLRLAREAAGYDSAATAARRFNWPYGTYSGHENGSRGFPAHRAPVYARCFRVEEQWLLFGKGQGPAALGLEGRATEKPSFGFSEPGVMPLRLQPDSASIAERAAALILQEQKGRDSYKITRSYPDYLLQTGDIVIIEVGVTPTQGELAVVNVVDEQRATCETTIRAQSQRGLVAPFSELSAETFQVSIDVLGRIKALFRDPGAPKAPLL